MASFNKQQQLRIMQALQSARSSASQTSNIPVPSFNAYLDFFTARLDTQKQIDDMKRFKKAFETTGNVLPGLQKATAQLHRYSYPKAATFDVSPNTTHAECQRILTEEIAPKGHSYFFEKVVPFLIDRALEWPELFPEGKLPLAEYDASITERTEKKFGLSRRQILTIHALCFLGCDPSFGAENPRMDVGSLAWFSLFASGTARVGVERILCQLMYFEYWRNHFDEKNSHEEPSTLGPQLDEVVTFSRVSYPEVDTKVPNVKASLPDWYDFKNLDDYLLVDTPPATKTTVAGTEDENKDDDAASTNNTASTATTSVFGPAISKHGINIDGKFMEDFDEATAHVDFANEQLMIGRLIPSATQEEVMFSVRPELLISLLLFNTMRPRESILMRNARVYTNYRGYRDTFQVNDFVSSLFFEPTTIKNSPEVIAIDSHVNWSASGKRQYQNEMNARDLDKAYIGYSSVECGDIISSGPWGAGAFACSRDLKLLQQLMVCAVCSPRRKYLCYYERETQTYGLLCKLMQRKKISVGEGARWIDEFSKIEGRAISMTSSDAAPPKQLGGVHHHHDGQQDGEEQEREDTIEELVDEVKILVNEGTIQKNTFLHFMFKKLMA